MSDNIVNTLDLTVIIPVHSVDDAGFIEYFQKAIESIAANEILPKETLIIRCTCKDVKATLNKLSKNGVIKDNMEKLNIRIIENEVGKSYQSMINEAVKEVTTEFFSVLEFDDEYSKIWFKNVAKYMEEYTQVDAFLPIVSEIGSDNTFKDLSNVAVWAISFNDEVDRLGYVQHEKLLEFESISTNGMVIRSDVYREIGGLKTNIKFSFNYEFLLRLTHKGIDCLVIPKVGYKHVNMREGSLFWEYKNGENKIEPVEAQFWMTTARKEFYYDTDRFIEFDGVSSNKTEENVVNTNG